MFAIEIIDTQIARQRHQYGMDILLSLVVNSRSWRFSLFLYKKKQPTVNNVQPAREPNIAPTITPILLVGVVGFDGTVFGTFVGS